MATTATKRKVGKLYENLTPIERIRLMAQLSREHNPTEMDHLRDATPIEHAQSYNRALGLLRVLNGNTPDWFTAFHLGMERDRFRLQHASSTAAARWLIRSNAYGIWELIPYPVTASEYRAIARLERAELHSIEEYGEHIWGGNPTDLRPELAAINQEYREEMSEEEKDALWDRFYSCFTEAIERGDLPKPKRRRKPRGAKIDTEDGLWLPNGALSDWAEGTSEDTYEPLPPGFSIPVIGKLFDNDMQAKWDIYPDSEAEDVKARRSKIRDVFAGFLPVSRIDPSRLPSFDPPLTAKERERSRKLTETLWNEWDKSDDLAEIALDAAKTHAVHRAQLEDLITAIDTVIREDFGGEDPLWPEVRAVTERAQEEAARFDETWDNAQVSLRSTLREMMGLDALSKGENGLPTIEAAPLPTGEHDVEHMLQLIREWGS